jgi:ethanolamine ammonia-lyase large subunit
VIMLIGERPGGDENASRSMSAYLVLRLANEERSQAAVFSDNPDVRFEYSVISNIHAGGLPPVEAGGVIARQALDILQRGAAGNRLAAQA